MPGLSQSAMALRFVYKAAIHLRSRTHIYRWLSFVSIQQTFLIENRIQSILRILTSFSPPILTLVTFTSRFIRYQSQWQVLLSKKGHWQTISRLIRLFCEGHSWSQHFSIIFSINIGNLVNCLQFNQFYRSYFGVCVCVWSGFSIYRRLNKTPNIFCVQLKNNL